MTEDDDEQRGELAQFITETLVQISQGVSDAQTIVGPKGGSINPVGRASGLTTYKDLPKIRLADNRFGYMQIIQFDIAISRESGVSGGGKAGVHVASIEIGGKAEKQSSESNLSRIKFALPIVLPGQADPKVEAEIDASASEHLKPI